MKKWYDDPEVIHRIVVICLLLSLFLTLLLCFFTFPQRGKLMPLPVNTPTPLYTPTQTPIPAQIKGVPKPPQTGYKNCQ